MPLHKKFLIIASIIILGVAAIAMIVIVKHRDTWHDNSGIIKKLQ